MRKKVDTQIDDKKPLHVVKMSCKLNYKTS